MSKRLNVLNIGPFQVPSAPDFFSYTIENYNNMLNIVLTNPICRTSRVKVKVVQSNVSVYPAISPETVVLFQDVILHKNESTMLSLEISPTTILRVRVEGKYVKKVEVSVIGGYGDPSTGEIFVADPNLLFRQPNFPD
ncbi:hypothetical protein [Tepidibacillus decaturensis]|uniref:Uncharacterized protein n=1 Tax=Tepidibacillus decaturensis TaxID=1413211 RepID=A0A135L3P4_9BACI|nr:hypothetical protein [Tepidibacillus decaturensis]KXG43570.1 hypothetical protein U473_05750 [Tepidibacillus decaturensis]